MALNVSSITLVQSNMRNELNQIQKLRDQLVAQQQTLNNEFKWTPKISKTSKTRKRRLSKQHKTKKSNLLKQTKGQEAAYQKTACPDKGNSGADSESDLPTPRRRQLTFQQAFTITQNSRKGQLEFERRSYSQLDRESGLGQNVGKCPYTTAMNPTRDAPLFLKLLDALHIDPSSQAAYVSCPNQHGTYGGAMGPAQFIPSTWNLYANEVSKITWETIQQIHGITRMLSSQPPFHERSPLFRKLRKLRPVQQNVSPYQTLLERQVRQNTTPGAIGTPTASGTGNPLLIGQINSPKRH